MWLWCVWPQYHYFCVCSEFGDHVALGYGRMVFRSRAKSSEV